MTQPLRLAMVARVPEAGVRSFAEYEARVLPLLVRYGVRLERRVRNASGTLEIHLLEFPDSGALAAFRADPERKAASSLLRVSGAQITLEAVEDVLG